MIQSKVDDKVHCIWVKKEHERMFESFRYLLFELEYIFNKLLSGDYPNFISSWTMLSRNSTKKRESVKEERKRKEQKLLPSGRPPTVKETEAAAD